MLSIFHAIKLAAINDVHVNYHDYCDDHCDVLNEVCLSVGYFVGLNDVILNLP
jgi:hypothetical protein